jgi:acyl-CoA thioesterase
MEQPDLESIRRYFRADRFATGLLGISIADARPGYCKVEMDINENHINGAGVIQGGVMFTLADFAGAVASNSHGYTALSINSFVSFINAGRGKKLFAVATETDRSRKISNIDVEITDESDRRIAIVKGTYYITEREINFNQE